MHPRFGLCRFPIRHHPSPSINLRPDFAQPNPQRLPENILNILIIEKENKETQRKTVAIQPSAQTLMYRPPPQQQQQVVIPDAANLGALAIRGVTAFARRHKFITGSYLFGILVVVIMGSGTKLTVDQPRKYNSIMNTINLEAEYDASQQYWQAQQAYYASKGWFSCDSLCQRNKERMEHAKRVLDEIRQEGNARMSDAKAVAGLFSEVGVGEVKDSFWQYFYQGKQFAKRQSMWDAMFMGIRHMGRDEG